jgi:hypothetical protein
MYGEITVRLWAESADGATSAARRSVFFMGYRPAGFYEIRRAVAGPPTAAGEDP